MNLTEFNNTYFYKTELQKICKQYQLPTYGTKAELETYIQKYLSGIPASEIIQIRNKVKRTSPLNSNQITIKTKLLDSDFSLNKEACQFFADYFNVAEFHFKKTMAVKLREVQKNNDCHATVMDLINALEDNHITQDNADESSYQWNNFVKDFCASPKSKRFNQKLAVAAILWQDAKNQPGSKRYNDNLIQLNIRKIQKFVKK